MPKSRCIHLPPTGIRQPSGRDCPGQLRTSEICFCGVSLLACIRGDSIRQLLPDMVCTNRTGMIGGAKEGMRNGRLPIGEIAHWRKGGHTGAGTHRMSQPAPWKTLTMAGSAKMAPSSLPASDESLAMGKRGPDHSTSHTSAHAQHQLPQTNWDMCLPQGTAKNLRT